MARRQLLVLALLACWGCTTYSSVYPVQDPEADEPPRLIRESLEPGQRIRVVPVSGEPFRAEYTDLEGNRLQVGAKRYWTLRALTEERQRLRYDLDEIRVIEREETHSLWSTMAAAFWGGLLGAAIADHQLDYDPFYAHRPDYPPFGGWGPLGESADSDRLRGFLIGAAAGAGISLLVLHF